MGPAVGAENSLKTLKFKALVIFLKKNIFVEKCAVFCTIMPRVARIAQFGYFLKIL